MSKSLIIFIPLQTLLPVSNLRRLQFWHEYFLRFDEFNVVSASEVLDEMEQKNAPVSFIHRRI